MTRGILLAWIGAGVATLAILTALLWPMDADVAPVSAGPAPCSASEPPVTASPCSNAVTEAFLQFGLEAIHFWCDAGPVIRAAQADVLADLG